MKNYFFNICIIGLAIFASFSTSDTVDELIRRKVEENLPAYNTLNRNDKIFCTPSVREVYFKNNFKPFWGNTEQVSELISAIEKCDNEGLNPDDYHLSVILRLKQNKSAENDADLDIILTDAFLLYTSHILSGKTNPLTIKAEWHVLKTDKNPVKYLYEINSKGINKILSEIKPQNKNYNYLISALKVYRDIEKNGGWKRVDKGKVIKLGMSDKRIAKIRQRLRITNDYTVNDPTDIDSYDDTLKLAVVNFQKRHGLEALGNIGDQTIEKLNIPVMEKIKSIVVNLERLRWLPLEDPRYYLLVNIANFELDVIENNKVVRHHKVIVGKPFRKTPVFSATMQYIVFNPTWTVPPTILKKDLIPEIKKDRSYLVRKNINIYDAKGIKINPDSIDWFSKKPYSYNYRQEPGKLNALGAVKFVFPNRFDVYLHDTPGKELFEKTERAFSSGCIRVNKPLELAEFLLKDQPSWNQKKIRKIIETTRTKTIILTKKPEVQLLYLTSWVDDSGQRNFRKDIYKRDEDLYKALTAKPVCDLN